MFNFIINVSLYYDSILLLRANTAKNPRRIVAIIIPPLTHCWYYNYWAEGSSGGVDVGVGEGVG